KVYLDELILQRRAARAKVGDKIFWVAAEKKKAFDVLFPSAIYLNELAVLPNMAEFTADAACFLLLQGWLSVLGATTAAELSQIFLLDCRETEVCLLRMESSGAILRGDFRTKLKLVPGSSAWIEWCDRRLLARIHKLTVSTLRKGIEPVTAAQFMKWLTHWQHVAPGSQLAGDERGTLEILRQLQGFEIPANAWEHQILRPRLKDYNSSVLDRLCLTGAVGWGRLSPHPATMESPEEGRTWRIVPSSVAPITFFVREDADWMAPKHPSALFEDNRGLSHEAAAVKDYLKNRGASFFADIVRGTNRLQSEVESALWELVAAGIVTADGFDNLRALIDPKRRSGQGRGRAARPRHSTGRWSIMHAEEVDRTKQLESICWLLLKRYGVVFRDILAKEIIVPRWRELLITFRSLEDRGEIRGGRFVSGFIGEQFAMPEAVESLRASRTRPNTPELLTLSATDPLNLIGAIIPGKKISSTSNNSITLKDGVEYTPPTKDSRLA
ncbi:MAG: hypothetical protein K2X81_09540, partial [Candidatus Obscuribacterales bacterium]|nr:hypothetical protein [Candidatus Obscuribacterales bacterium]